MQKWGGLASFLKDRRHARMVWAVWQGVFLLKGEPGEKQTLEKIVSQPG